MNIVANSVAPQSGEAQVKGLKAQGDKAKSAEKGKSEGSDEVGFSDMVEKLGASQANPILQKLEENVQLKTQKDTPVELSGKGLQKDVDQTVTKELASAKAILDSAGPNKVLDKLGSEQKTAVKTAVAGTLNVSKDIPKNDLSGRAAAAAQAQSVPGDQAKAKIAQALQDVNGSIVAEDGDLTSKEANLAKSLLQKGVSTSEFVQMKNALGSKGPHLMDANEMNILDKQVLNKPGGPMGGKASSLADARADAISLPTLDLNNSVASLVSSQVAPNPLNPQQLVKPKISKEMNAQVVKGSMATDRLSHASVVNLANGIRELRSKGGGEINLKLQPEELGNLNVRVSTQGQMVDLKIQAANPRAQQILEESVSHLKEGLAKSDLSLNRFDLSLQGASQSSLQSGSDSHHRSAIDIANRYDEMYYDNFGQQARDQGDQSAPWDRAGSLDQEDSIGLTAGRNLSQIGSMQPRSIPSVSGTGRLDVMA